MLPGPIRICSIEMIRSSLPSEARNGRKASDRSCNSSIGKQAICNFVFVRVHDAGTESFRAAGFLAQTVNWYSIFSDAVSSAPTSV